MHIFCHYFGLNQKSLAQKLTEENAFFIKLTIHDLLCPSGSPQVKGHGANERVRNYEFPSINYCNYTPNWRPFKDKFYDVTRLKSDVL